MPSAEAGPGPRAGASPSLGGFLMIVVCPGLVQTVIRLGLGLVSGYSFSLELSKCAPFSQDDRISGGLLYYMGK